MSNKFKIGDTVKLSERWLYFNESDRNNGLTAKIARRHDAPDAWYVDKDLVSHGGKAWHELYLELAEKRKNPTFKECMEILENVI